MNEIERIKKHLERAFANVSKLKVSGDAVDAVYETREELRMAFRLVTRMEAPAPEDDHTGRPLSQPSADSSPSQGEPLAEDGNKQEVKADAAAENEVQLPNRENDAG